jgi:Calcineurin-like phosphoesterase/FlgD Ig-like domain/Purple acid Phosphatase, N-terminal domain
VGGSFRRLWVSAALLGSVALVAPTTPSPAQTISIPVNSVWRYSATGIDLGSAWTDIGYDDAGWPSGPGTLGYGDPFIVTTVPFGPDPLNKYLTTYFRQTFQVGTAPEDVISLRLRVSYDDGFVAYINGQEVARRSMPAGPISYGTFAVSHEAGAYETITMPASGSGLAAGENVLAIEVHQSTVSSSDLAMDLELAYFTTAQVVRGPYLQIGTPNGVTVRWRTDLPTDSRVRFGPAPDDLGSSADDAALVTDHEVTLTGLEPETRYFYSVGTTSVPLAGGDFSYTFQTHPVPGPPHPTRFWIVGDGGTANADARAVRDAYAAYSATRPADLWLMLGDNAYPSGTDAEYQAAVFDTYPEQLRRTVLWPTRGNHEVLVAPPGQDYYDIFSLPTAAEAGGLASGTEAYYSFDYANIHFICLDSEGTDRSPGGAMLTWLANDLASTTRQWIVAFWHHPTYSKGSHDSDDDFDSGGRMRDMRTNALPILEAGGVDLVLSGHSHSYERSFLLDGHYGPSTTLAEEMKIDPGDGRVGGDGPYMKPVAIPSPHEGAVHTVAGTSGQASGGSLDHPVMVTSLNILGSMVVDVDGARLDARFLSSTGAVLDSFTILKGTATGVPVSGAPGVSLHLAPGRPSPFERATSIAYTLAQAGTVRLAVFDVNGRRVRTLRNGDRPSGSHAEVWDGCDDQGRPLAAGVYFARLEAAGATRVQRLALVR